MKNSLIVAKYTFLEVYRSKILIGLVFLALSLLLVCYVASEFAYGAPMKIALDFGLGITSLSNTIIAIFIGATILGKEIEKKTLYMTLSRPISRASFLIGKLLGLSGILIINTVLLTSVSVLMFKLYGGGDIKLAWWATMFSLVEAFILMIFAVLFSLITNVNMSVLYSLIILVVGHAVNESVKEYLKKNNSALFKFLDILSNLIPNFERMNLKDFIIYKQDLPLNYLMSVCGYSFLYVLGLLFITSFVFEIKNLD